MFKGKVAVITGAGSGIGRALALQLATEGARLALSDVNWESVNETLRLLPAGTVAISYTLDVSSCTDFFEHAEQVLRDFGSVHYVFNNAGVALFGTVEHTSIEEYEWQISINLWGVLYGTKAFLPRMLAQREGCIVNISSVFGFLGFPTQSAYNMTKFAVRGLTEALWSELEGTGVRAISVHPGGIKTNFEKSARWVKAAGAEEKACGVLAEKLLTTLPEACAADIIAGICHGKNRIITGNKSSTMFWMSRFMPNSYPRLLKMLG